MRLSLLAPDGVEHPAANSGFRSTSCNSIDRHVLANADFASAFGDQWFRLTGLGQNEIERAAVVALQNVVGREASTGVAWPVFKGRVASGYVSYNETDADIFEIIIHGCIARVIAERQIEQILRRFDVGVSVDQARDLAGLSNGAGCATADLTPTNCAPFQQIVSSILLNSRNSVASPAVQTLVYWINDGGTINKG